MTLLLSFAAGILTSLSPCVLPILPLILSGALSQHRAGPAAFALGLCLAFSVFGIVLLAAGSTLGLERHIIRAVAGAFILAFGLIMLSPGLQSRFAMATSGVADASQGRLAGFTPEGWPGQFVLGLVIGTVWTPCVGPTLGSAMALASRGEDLVTVSITMLAFGIGAALPLMLLAYGGREMMLKRRARWSELVPQLQTLLGWLLVAVAVMIFTGLDKRVEAALVALSPDWLTRLTTSL